MQKAKTRLVVYSYSDDPDPQDAPDRCGWILCDPNTDFRALLEDASPGFWERKYRWFQVVDGEGVSDHVAGQMGGELTGEFGFMEQDRLDWFWNQTDANGHPSDMSDRLRDSRTSDGDDLTQNEHSDKGGE